MTIPAGLVCIACVRQTHAKWYPERDPSMHGWKNSGRCWRRSKIKGFLESRVRSDKHLERQDGPLREQLLCRYRGLEGLKDLVRGAASRVHVRAHVVQRHFIFGCRDSLSEGQVRQAVCLCGWLVGWLVSKSFELRGQEATHRQCQTRLQLGPFP